MSGMELFTFMHKIDLAGKVLTVFSFFSSCFVNFDFCFFSHLCSHPVLHPIFYFCFFVFFSFQLSSLLKTLEISLTKVGGTPQSIPFSEPCSLETAPQEYKDERKCKIRGYINSFGESSKTRPILLRLNRGFWTITGNAVPREQLSRQNPPIIDPHYSGDVIRALVEDAKRTE